MSFDDQIRAALDSTAATLREHLEAQLLAAAQTHAEELRAQAQQQLDTARRIAQAEIEKARAEVERAHAEVDKAHAEADKTHAELDAARADIESVRQHATQAMEQAHTDRQQSELSRAARLVEAVRSLDEARSLSEVLDRLAQCAGHEVDRAAVLLVKSDRLTGWRLAGFGPDAAPAKSIDLGVEEAGVAGMVLRTRLAASRPSDAADGPGLPAFAVNAGERHAMALPIRVGGEVVAVLYADAPRVDTPSSDARWPAILEVLVRHASGVLEAMTVQQAAGLSLSRPMARDWHVAVPGPVEQAGTGEEDAARRYARLLLSEIRMYHEPIVDAARRSGDLMSHLHGEIERARKLYDARVPASVSARREYFDQELVRTLAGGDHTLLGSAQ